MHSRTVTEAGIHTLNVNKIMTRWCSQNLTEADCVPFGLFPILPVKELVHAQPISKGLL